jgi:hypothetical protein
MDRNPIHMSKQIHFIFWVDFGDKLRDPVDQPNRDSDQEKLDWASTESLGSSTVKWLHSQGWERLQQMPCQ